MDYIEFDPPEKTQPASAPDSPHHRREHQETSFDSEREPKDNRTRENRTSDNRTSENRTRDNQSRDNRASENRPRDNNASENYTREKYTRENHIQDTHKQENYTPAGDGSSKGPRASKGLLYGGIILLLLILGFAIFSFFQANRATEAARAANDSLAQLTLAYQQLELQNEYDILDQEFQQYETQRIQIHDDSVKRELQDKYNAAKLRVEQLLDELKNEKQKSQEQIAKLKEEIATLRGILKHYVEEIDRLNKENEELRTENQEIKSQNEKLASTVATTTAQNERLTERMTLAEKLNVTGLSVTPLNSKGKKEKKIQKAKQLMVNFTIPQNNSTPAGEKTIYLRIVSPTGDVLSSGSTFPFEGGAVAYTARKNIEYQNEELPVTIYWDVNMALSAGDYTVELFADNYRLISRKIALN